MLIILMYTHSSLFVLHMHTQEGQKGDLEKQWKSFIHFFFYGDVRQFLDSIPHVCPWPEFPLFPVLYSEKRIPIQEPGPLTNVPPCQRQRGFKTGGFGRLYHLQAIFQPIHLARIIECPCLSTPGGVTSYHKPPAPLLIKQGMGGSS